MWEELHHLKNIKINVNNVFRYTVIETIQMNSKYLGFHVSTEYCMQ